MANIKELFFIVVPEQTRPMQPLPLTNEAIGKYCLHIHLSLPQQ